ncbi:MAG: hypothetical protein Q4P05_03850 [Actinomycetaceae bacterium]|nr:hypothetical protein [Actinomycetaceae bacterium]
MNPIEQAQQYLAHPQCNEQTLQYIAQNFPQLHEAVVNHPAATYQVLGYLSTYAPDPAVRNSATQRLSLAPSASTAQMTAPHHPQVASPQPVENQTPVSQQDTGPTLPSETYGPPQHQPYAPTVNPVQTGGGKKPRKTGLILLGIAAVIVLALVAIVVIGGKLGWLSGSTTRTQSIDYSLQPIKVSMPGESEVSYYSSKPHLRVFAVTNWDTEDVVVYRMEDGQPVEVLTHSSDELIGLTNEAAIFADYEYGMSSRFIVKKSDFSSGEITVMMDLADKISGYSADERQTPLVVANQVVAMADDQTLQAFDFDGNETWSYSLMSFNSVEYMDPIGTNIIRVEIYTGDNESRWVLLDARTGETLVTDLEADVVLTEYVDGFALSENSVTTFYSDDGEQVGQLTGSGTDYSFYDECSKTVRGAYDAYTAYFQDHPGISNLESLCDGHVIRSENGAFTIDGETVAVDSSPWYSCDKTTKSCVVLNNDNGEFFGFSLENPSEIYWSHIGGSWYWRGNGYAGVESPDNDVFYIVGR